MFANPSRLAWRGNPDFAHWRAGPVFESIDQLESAIAQSIACHGDYVETQKELFAYTFDLGQGPSSERAAAAIARYLGAAPASSGAPEPQLAYLLSTGT